MSPPALELDTAHAFEVKNRIGGFFGRRGDAAFIRSILDEVGIDHQPDFRWQAEEEARLVWVFHAANVRLRWGKGAISP